jgi:hypothetical protein
MADEEKPAQAQFIQRQAAEEEKPAQAQLIQRQTADEEKPAQAQLIQPQTAEEEKPAQTQLVQNQTDEENLAGAESGGGAGAFDPGTAESLMANSGPGNRLSPATRDTLEPKMGVDLSETRVHTDSAANQAAGALNARAFTKGNDIYLARGESANDVGLMAHETTHAAQQGAASRLPAARMPQPETDAEEPIQRQAAPAKTPAAARDDVAPGVVELKGQPNFPTEKIVPHFETRRKGKVRLKYGSMAEGVVDIRKTRRGKLVTADRSKRNPGRQAIPIKAHPLLGQLGLSLIVELSADGQVKGYLGYASLSRINFKKIRQDSEKLGLSGFDLGAVASIENKLEGGSLSFGLNKVKFTLGGAFKGDLSITADDERIVSFQGKAIVKARGLATGDLILNYAPDKGVTGGAKIGLKLPKNVTGSVDVSWDGQAISGEGKVAYQGEKLSGDVTLRLMDKEKADQLEQQKKAPDQEAKKPAAKKGGGPPKKVDYVVFGEGDLNFTFTDWLSGTAHVILDPKGHVTIIGKIEPQKEFQLFEPKDYNKEFFTLQPTARYGIPVVGSIGIYAKLAIGAFAKLEGKLHKISAEGTYSTDPKKSNDFSIRGTVNISAAAGLKVRGEAGAVLEILGHDIKAGAGLDCIAGIRGYAEATPIIGYREKAGAEGEDKKGEFFIRGEMEVAAQAFLGLAGDLFVEIDAPWWSPVPDKKWTWPLGSKEYPLGRSFGLKASVDYVFGSGQWPAVELEPVEFSADKFVTDLYADKAKGKSGEKKTPGTWKEKNSKDAVPPPKDGKKGTAERGKAPEKPPPQPTVKPGGPKKKAKSAPDNARTAEGKTVKEYKKEASAKKGKPAPKEPTKGTAKEAPTQEGTKKQVGTEQDRGQKWNRGVGVVKQALAYAEREGIDQKDLNRILKSIKKRKEYGFSKLYAKDAGDRWLVLGSMSPDDEITKVKKKSPASLEKELRQIIPEQKLSYPTDTLSRPKGPFGHIPRAGGEARQSLPPKGRGYHKGDHRGHLIGDRFGGAPVAGNLVPMHPQLNLSSFKTFENQVAEEYKQKKKEGLPFLLYMKVAPNYPSRDKNDEASYRPSGITPRADIITLGAKGKVKRNPIRPGYLDNPESVPEEKTVLINEASAQELAGSIPGVGISTAVKLQAALEQVEISRTADLDNLTNFEGIGLAMIQKLKDKRARGKLKYYEMEVVEE